MLYRRQRSTKLWVLWAMGCNFGCAAPQPDPQFLALRQSVEALRAQVARFDARLEGLRNDVLMAKQRLDGMVRERNAAGPPIPDGLAVVRLQPQEPLFDDGGAAMAPPTSGTQEPAAESVHITQAPDGSLQIERSQDKDAFVKRDLYTKALLAFRRGEPQMAREHFAQVESLGGDDAAKAAYWIGECEFEMGNYAAAAAAFERSLRQRVDTGRQPEAMMKLGLSYENLGQSDLAREAFEHLVKRYPSSALAELARARLKGPEQETP